MKKHYVLYTILILSISCRNNKQDNNNPTQMHLNVELNETNLGNKADSIDFSSISRLTQAQYDSMQIRNIEDINVYEPKDFSMGRILFNEKNGKLLTVQIITEGEITEYLLSYNNEGKLMDNLLVAYEDLVEYYSQISTTIKSNEIAVQTITFNYEDADENSSESADTVIVNYQITPDLKFVLNK